MATKVKALYRAAVRFGGGSYGKNSASLGCKIPVAVCGPKMRDEYFVNAKLRVILSLDPKTDDAPVLAGMEDEFPSIELDVKVNQHSINNSDVGFSMAFGKSDVPAEFFRSISHAAGSLYVLKVTANEDGSSVDTEDDSEEDEDE